MAPPPAPRPSPGRRAPPRRRRTSPVLAQVEKRHDEAVKRLQEWIRQPSIAAENRGMTRAAS